MIKETLQGSVVFKWTIIMVQTGFFRPNIMSMGLNVLSVRNEDFKTL